MIEHLKPFLPLCVINLVLDYAKNAIVIFDNNIPYLFDGMKLHPFNFELEKSVVCYFGNQILKFFDGKWVHLSEANVLLDNWFNCAFTSTNSFLYLSGGINSSYKHLKTVYKFNLKTYRFIEFPPMNSARVEHSLTVLNNKLYAIGGKDIFSMHSTVECFNGKQWTSCKSMNNQRHGHKSIAHKGKIYIFGGRDSDENNMSVERYDPEKNQWTIITYMPTFRKDFQIISLENNIYIISKTDIDIYNPDLDEWINFKHGKNFSPSCLTIL